MKLNEPKYIDTRVVQPFTTQSCPFKRNVVKNSKYTLLSFLPKNLIEQFSYPLNVYFLAVSLLQFVSLISPVNPLSTLLPLVFAFFLSACKEGIDDYYRHVEDKVFNRRQYSKLSHNKQEEIIQSKELCVGDIVRVQCNEEIPADMILLYSSNENGFCQIQTDKIDGETRLKGREVESQLFSRIVDPSSLHELLSKVKITCPAPGHRQHEFEGFLSLASNSFHIGPKQFLPQGGTIRSAQWVYGMVVYTGDDTVCFWNKRPPSFKRAKIDYQINRYSMGIFFFQICVVLGFGIAGGNFYIQQSKDSLQSTNFTDWFIVPARFFLLMAIMIPISFKVVIDVSKYITSRFISWDPHMGKGTHSQKDRVIVSNSSIAEDLACVQYILTDKTGTLTENKMDLRGVCVPGEVLNAPFATESISGNLEDNPVPMRTSQNVQVLLEHMILCHSAHRTANFDSSAFASPEEVCLIRACGEFRYHLRSGNRNGHCSVSTPGGVFSYSVLDEFAFTSDRRRMSILLFDHQRHTYRLFTKGAEEEIFRRLRHFHDSSSLTASIADFSANALRVLAMGARDISESEFTAFQASKETQFDSLQSRQAHLHALWNKMERNLTLLGACAIGDNLQVGVAETIETLRDGAGVHFWMLTGDKQQTAWEVARRSRLVNESEHSVRITNKKDIADVMQNTEKDTKITTKPFNLLIHGGDTFDRLFRDYPQKFIPLAIAARSVIIYRISAEQKAAVARLVKKHTASDKVTLAIGDGGNDVAMIQAADVGVGIAGAEGSHAARAADFAVTQFCDISRLLLVHGHFCHRRTSYIILYSFYKSMLVSFAQLLFNPFRNLSGVSFWDSMQLTMWNGLHTMPIVFAAIFDRSHPQDGLLANPALYRRIREGNWFNLTVFIQFLLRGQLQALLLLAGVIVLFGEDVEFSLLNALAYTVGLLLQIVTMAFDTQTFTVVHLLAAFCTLGVFGLTTAFHSVFVPQFSLYRFLQMWTDGRLYALLTVVLLPTIWGYSMGRLWNYRINRKQS